jgi:hypothetical protein
MKGFLKKAAVRVLEPLKTYPTHATDKQAVVDLIGKLRPCSTGHELVRLGPEGDGGYLLPDDLDGIVALFSPGVYIQSGFEKDCADRGMQVFMADKTVDGPSTLHERFQFTKKHIGAFSDAETMTLDSWAREAGVEVGDLMLQMDVEGFEYEVLLSLSEELLSRFRIVIFELLLQTHLCVHIHPNNWNGIFKYQGVETPRVAELTFLRKDHAIDLKPANRFPHPLDFPNGPGPDLPLPNSWYA